MTPWHHAVSSAKQFGGEPNDYLPVHEWFDESKAHFSDRRHRALRHHSFGIQECEKTFGPIVTNTYGKQIPTKLIGEQHVKEDLGFIPTVKDWLSSMSIKPWARKVAVTHSEIDDAS
jgi:hypothetical protein